MSISSEHDVLSCDRGLRRQAIVQSILVDVFEGRLETGRHLVTQDLAERFGVSHTPVREALIELAGIGILDIAPNRGAIVRRVSTKDVREISQVRRALECEAARSACGRIDPAELANLAVELRRLTTVPAKSRVRFVERARALDSRLHDLIAASCGNAFLTNELNRLKGLFRGLRDASYTRHKQCPGFNRLTEEAYEHLAIVEAIQAGDRHKAALAMSQHIKSGMRYWVDSLPSSAEVPPGTKRSKSKGSNGHAE